MHSEHASSDPSTAVQARRALWLRPFCLLVIDTQGRTSQSCLWFKQRLERAAITIFALDGEQAGRGSHEW